MAISNRCKGCGGELRFDFDTQNLKCSQCEATVDIPSAKTLNNKKTFDENSTIKQKEVDSLTYKCEHCGRTCIIQQNEASLRCAYCGSPNLMVSSKVEYVPDGIVPFKLNRRRAGQCFVDWIRKKRFLPSHLKRKVTKSEFSPIYLPIYNYDFNCYSSYSGTGVDYDEDAEGNKIEKVYHFSGTKSSVFNDYIESANKELNSYTLKKFGNFNFNNLYVFRTEYLYGISALEADVDLQNNCHNTQRKIENIIEENIKSEYNYDYIRSFNCKTTFQQIAYNHLYVPVWVHTFNYKNKDYAFFINGSTGKVHGKVPRSPGKILLTVLGIILGVGLTALLIYLLAR